MPAGPAPSASAAPSADVPEAPASAPSEAEAKLRSALHDFGLNQDDERSRQFMQAISNTLPEDKRTEFEQLLGGGGGGAAAGLSESLFGAPSAKAKPCILEGWWYEADQPAQGTEHLRRLMGVAKASGAAAVASKMWEDALEHYYSALEMTPRGDNELGTLHCNCALVLTHLERFEEALEHCGTAIRVWPKWHKPYARKAAALEGLARLRRDDPPTLKEALESYQDAFTHTTSADRAARAELREAIERVEARLPRVEDITDDGEATSGGRSGTTAPHGITGIDEATYRRAYEAAVGVVEEREAGDAKMEEGTVAEAAEAAEAPTGPAKWAAEVRAALEADAAADSDSDDDIGEPLDAPQAFVPKCARVVEV